MANRILAAVIFSIAAWFLGVVLDVNIADGVWSFRTLLPILVMGSFIIYRDVYKRQSVQRGL